jgi:hypothetical protein
MAIKQGEKVRPVLNLSLPKNCSFNSNVDEEKLEKVYMSSAQKFSKLCWKRVQIQKCSNSTWLMHIKMSLQNLKISEFKIFHGLADIFLRRNKFFEQKPQFAILIFWEILF